MKDRKDNKKTILSGIVNIVLCARGPASKVQKTPAKPSYSLVGFLHFMQGGRGQGSNILASINFY